MVRVAFPLGGLLSGITPVWASDAAEYKLWGNGVALPCVFFVLAGIVYYTQNND